MTKRTKAPAKKQATTKRPKRSTDFNQRAQQLVRESTESCEVQPEDPTPIPSDADIRRVMAELGRRGGKIGGRKRADGMTVEQRSNAAALAARARWSKQQQH